jgi:hypothetical protein
MSADIGLTSFAAWSTSLLLYLTLVPNTDHFAGCVLRKTFIKRTRAYLAFYILAPSIQPLWSSILPYQYRCHFKSSYFHRGFLGFVNAQWTKFRDTADELTSSFQTHSWVV